MLIPWTSGQSSSKDYCSHKKCKECNGTGRKKNGSFCVHMISCRCKKCNPSNNGCGRFTTYILMFILSLCGVASATDNFYKTTRYFGSDGRYYGSERSYSSGRSFYYDKQGKYSGQSFKSPILPVPSKSPSKTIPSKSR